MPDTKRADRLIAFSGGVLSDTVGPGDGASYLENLVPPTSSNMGLAPREGIEWLYTLPDTTRTNNTCSVFLVTLDDITRQKMVVVQDPSTKQILHITKYTEQAGVTALPPFGCGHASLDDPGGEGCHLPVTPTPAPEFGNLLYFEHDAVDVVAGEVVTLTVKGVNQGGTTPWSTEDDTGKAGTDYTETGGNVTASDSSDGSISVQTAGAGLGKKFQVYLYDPAGDARLKNPSMCEVSIGHLPRPLFGSVDDNGSNFAFYNTETASFTVVTGIEPTMSSPAAIVTKNYLVIHNVTNFGDTEDRVAVYDLSTILNGTPTAKHVISNSRTSTLTLAKWFPYKGDILYCIQSDGTLYKYDLAAGTRDAGTAITGFPSASFGLTDTFGESVSLAGEVDINGALNPWATIGDPDTSHGLKPLTIPTDGSSCATASNYIANAYVFGDTCIQESDNDQRIVSPLAAGGFYMMRATRDASHNITGARHTVISADYSSWSDVATTTGKYQASNGFNITNGNISIAITDRAQTYTDPFYVAMNRTTGAELHTETFPMVGTVKQQLFYSVASANADEMVVFRQDTSNSPTTKYFATFVSVTTGEPTSEASFEAVDGMVPVLDCFGYGVENIQGDGS